MTCPACQSQEVVLAFTDLLPFGFEKRIYRCRRCGLGFVSPTPSREMLLALYGSESYFFKQTDDHLGYTVYEPTTTWFVDLLRKLRQVRANDPLLEIGSATGELLLLAKEHGFKGLGIEPSKWAAQKAQEKGVKVLVGFFEEVAKTLPSASFGSIVMSHVIEHFSDPKGVLNECSRLLRSGGWLAILTLNYAAPKWQDPRQAYLTSREHLFYFTPNSLRLMLEAAGFKVRQSILQPCPSPSAWAEVSRKDGTFSWVRFFSKGITWAYKRWFLPAFRLREWSEMIVLAQRRI